MNTSCLTVVILSDQITPFVRKFVVDNTSEGKNKLTVQKAF